MDWKDWVPYVVLAIVALRESLLLIAGLGAKRRTDNSIGSQSVEAWQLKGQQLVENALESSGVRRDLDELLDRKRRRR